MNTCLFCKFVKDGGVPLVWENEDVIAFKDIHPKAPVHLLVVPRRHMVNLDELDDPELAGRILMAVRDVAHAAGVKGGWQVRVNNGEKVGQMIPHLHFHILGGKVMPE